MICGIASIATAILHVLSHVSIKSGAITTGDEYMWHPTIVLTNFVTAPTFLATLLIFALWLIVFGAQSGKASVGTERVD